MLFFHQEPGMLQHNHGRGVLKQFLLRVLFMEVTDIPSARSQAHLRVVTAASIRNFCLQQLLYAAIVAA